MDLQLEIDNYINKALGFVNEDKYQNAEDVIEYILNNKLYLNELNFTHWQYIGDINLVIGKFDLAKTAYSKSKASNLPALAFTLILTNDLEEASNVLKDAPISCASIWCGYLTDLFLKNKVARKYPTFLIIRHFLELTVYHLLLAKNDNSIQLLLDDLGKLLEINQDSEKLIAFAYFHFGKLEEAIRFLNHALKINPLDGEIYFTLGQIHLIKNAPHDALSMLLNAQILLPEHLPTKELLEKTRLLVQEKNT